MHKAAICSLAFLMLAACESAPSSNYDYGPPPSVAPPRTGMHPYVAQSPRAPQTQVRNVKPLGAGVLTAQNVEAYTDNEENELRAALRGSGVLVARVGDNLVINMRSDTLFSSGSAALSSRAADLLQSVALVVRKYDSTQLQVNGYTDTTGSPEQNQVVSQARASAVAKALTDSGVNPRRVLAHGLGETNLKIPTGSGVNESRNRRIEIRITPVMKA
jgi:outer membrane protein OmpA-like peptidoglycan-associated protein